MPLRCLLIGGRSNVGKSTVAETLAARLGGVHRSTDKLGRHPGRPWGIVPPHVVAHYMNHTDEAIFDALLAHQRSMQPAIAELMRMHDTNLSGPVLVLEGSAIMPEKAAHLRSTTIRAVWLTASDDFVRQRIETASCYGDLDGDGRRLIERFLERNRRLDALLREEAVRTGLPLVKVDGKEINLIADECLAEAG